jgi:DNA-binding transcriptional ArsR family regulator
MIVVRLSARSLAEVRLAPSPASEIVAWLRISAAERRHPLLGDPGPSARFAMRHPDVALIATMLRDCAGYVPDLLTPKPPPDPWAQILCGQLDVVRETPSEAVAAQLLLGRHPDHRMPAGVRRAMEAGSFARRAANGLQHFWRTALSDNWRTLDAAMAADLRRRAWTLATHGIGHAFGSLHSKLRWSGDHLRIDMRYEEESDLTDAELVLSPAILGWPRLRVQVCDPGNAVIVYPASAFDVGAHRDAPRLATLVGSTRARILAGLDTPSTTTQLSRAYGLAPSTISHHLSVLVKAGMVAKSRRGPVVHYGRTARGDALLGHHPDDAAR